jgi:outer membrane protein OmpA-like peptidoglycan-associated protein
MEVLGGLAWRPVAGWTLSAGAGPGLTDGLGTPDYRLAAAARFSPVREEPAADTDGDGLPDERDTCPTRAEDRDGFPDRDGCPEADNDGDRVLDDADECPQTAELAGGDGDGCPDRGRVRMHRGRLDVEGKVLFASASSELDPRSDTLLDDVAAMLEEHPEIAHLEIRGHTDDQGDAEMNDDLSQRRADSVKCALVARGIAADRLSTKGFGERRPIAPNDTPAGLRAVDDGFAYFRVRLDDDPMPNGTGRPFAWGIELDADGDTATFEARSSS